MRIYQPDRDYLERFIRANAPDAAGRVLDVGGGNGKRYSSYFINASTYATLDADPATGPDIVAGAEDIPLDDASVDGILCSEVLMYVADVPKAMAEMARVLVPGGKLILTTSFMATPAVHAQYRWQPGYAGLTETLGKHFSRVSVEPRGKYHVQMRQNRTRHAIVKHRLYDRTLVGKLYSLANKLLTVLSAWRDQRDRTGASDAFTMGYNVLCTK